MSALLPTRPIERAYVTVQGDPNAGISHGRFTFECHLEPVDLNQLALDRARIAECYEYLHGGRASVVFDHEVAAEAEADTTTQLAEDRDSHDGERMRGLNAP